MKFYLKQHSKMMLRNQVKFLILISICLLLSLMLSYNIIERNKVWLNQKANNKSNLPEYSAYYVFNESVEVKLWIDGMLWYDGRQCLELNALQVQYHVVLFADPLSLLMR